MVSLLTRSRESTRSLSLSSLAQRNAALEAVAREIEARGSDILKANRLDQEAAQRAGMSTPLLDRLILDETRLRKMLQSLREVIELPDPLGTSRELGTRPNGLRIQRRRIPLGVLAIIYEARPNVTVEASSLAIKSGNAIVLRGGKEALLSNHALSAAVRSGLEKSGLPIDCVQLIEDTDRERVTELLGAVGYVDLAIPRGGPELMKMVDAYARVPVIRHGLGITHLFLDASANATMASDIVFNSKVQRPGVCNALETLLVHRSLLTTELWRPLAERLVTQGNVELRVDEEVAQSLRSHRILHRAAQDDDWDTEFMALTLAVRTVGSLDEALNQIAAHGSHHTASIVTEDSAHAERFLQSVDAACVLWNASTRFNDGNELGLGAEIGISTTKMHAFGPMGLNELTAEKFVVYGAGQVRS